MFFLSGKFPLDMSVTKNQTIALISFNNETSSRSYKGCTCHSNAEWE